MNNARRLLTWSLLTVYLSVSLFGELVHLAQCASCVADTVSRGLCQTCCCHQHKHAEQPTEDPPHSGHHSDSCSVCQVLAIASDRVPMLVELVSIDRVSEALIPIRESAVSSHVRDTQSRGPPLA